MIDCGRKTKFAITSYTARSSSAVGGDDEPDLGNASTSGHEAFGVLAVNDETRIPFAIDAISSNSNSIGTCSLAPG